MNKLIVGLGNPGEKYSRTRHNIGWLALDFFLSNEVPFWKKKFKGEYFQYKVKDIIFIFVKPLTYMNLSGECVQPMANFFKVKTEDILVVYDEVDLPFGRIVLKSGGGFAGHNGLKSMNQCLGSDKFKRLRMGVDKPVHGDVGAHVLSKFSTPEWTLMTDYLELTKNALESYTKEGYEKTATLFSKKEI